MSDVRLRTRALTVGYDRPLFPSFDLDVAAGEIVAILGASGTGKSTLLNTIAGITPPLSGTASIDGVDVTHAPIQQRRCGLVFQEPLLFPHLDVLDNVSYGLRRHGATKDAAHIQARALLSWVGLAGYEHRSVQQLSGGQAQRVALARALAPEPAVMLLDEPFSALDVELRQRLVLEVGAVLRERGCAALYVTHDPIEAETIADRVLRISA